MVRALRQLPGLHGLRDRLPVGRAVRPADRGHPRAGRAQLRARSRASARSAGSCSRCSPTPAACARWRPCSRWRSALGLDRLAPRRAAQRLAPQLAALLALAPTPRRGALTRLPERSRPRGERRGAWRCSRAACSGCSSRTSTGPRRACSPPRAARCSRPRAPRCCGALQLHAGDGRRRASLAQATIAALEGYDTWWSTPPAAARR